VPAIEIGRICIKLRGREAGRKCVIVDLIDENYVLITGPKKVNGVKRRRVNIKHIEPLDLKVELNRGASDDEVLKSLEASNLIEFMKERIKIDRKLLITAKAVKEGVSR